MNPAFFFCFLFSVVHITYGQFPYLGKCPTPDVKENFDIEKFSGRWYEIERTMSVLELGATCVAVNYTDAGYGDGSIEVINEGISAVLKLRKSVRLVATLPDKNEPAKWSLRLSDLSLKTGYWILDTDYDNYAVIWACNHIWLTFKYARTENLWILSRERTLSEEISNKIHEKLDEMKDIKSRKLLRKVTQENCD